MIGRRLLRDHIRAATPRRRRRAPVGDLAGAVALGALLVAIAALAGALWLLGGRGG